MTKKRYCPIHKKEMSIRLVSFGDVWDEGWQTRKYVCPELKCEYIEEEK